MDDSNYAVIGSGGSVFGGSYSGHLRVDGTWGPIGTNSIGQLLFVGYSDSSNGTVTIGASSTANVGNGLNSGFLATDPYYDYWAITDFSTQALYPAVFVGYGAGSTGTLNVSGTLNVIDALGVYGKIYLAYATGSTGILNITQDGATKPGAVNADAIEFGAGTGSIVIETMDGVTLGADISGAGSLSFSKNAGATDATVTLTGDSSAFTGSGTVNSGTLEVTGSLGGTLDVLSGASLFGAGGFLGDVTIENGGALGGSSGTLLTFDSLVLNDTSTVEVSLTTNPDNPLFAVTGDFTLDGLLQVSGMTDATHRLFSYGGTLTNNGLTLDAVPAGFNAGDWAISAGAGLVSLYRASADNIQYWDGSIVDTTSAEGGSGTWNAINTNWTNLDGNVNAAWASGKASFGGTAGTVTVDGPQTFTGLVFTVDGYALQDGTAGALAIDGATSDAPITVDTGTASVGVGISGTGGIAKAGTGTLNLQAVNSYTGATTVQAGTLGLAGAGDIGASSGIDVQAGTTFSIAGLTGTSTTVGNLTGSGTITLGGKTLVTTSSGTTFSGTLSGTGELHKQGSGTFTLSGTGSSYTALQVATGTVSVTSTTAVNDGVALTLSNNGTFAMGVAETVASLDGSSGTSVTLGSSNSLTVGSGTFAGVISGTGSVVKTGTGTFTLQGANTWTGGSPATKVTEGTLKIDGGGSITQTSNNIEVGTSSGKTGTLDIANGLVKDSAATVATVAGSTGVVTVGASGTWTSGSTITIGSAGTGSLTVSAGGQASALKVAVGSASGSSGTVVVTGSGSKLTSTGTSGSNNITIGVASGGVGSVLVADGAILKSSVSSNSVQVLNGTLSFGALSTDTAAASGTLEATNLVANTNNSKIVFNHTSTLTINSTITLGTSSAGGTLTHYAGSTTLAGQVKDAAFNGQGKIVVEGGTLALTYEPFVVGFTGSATIKGGTLALGNSATLGDGSIAFSGSTAGTLRLDGNFRPNTIAGFGKEDIVDLQALNYDSGTVTASYSSGTVTVAQTATGANFQVAFSGLSGNFTFVTVRDTDGSTQLRMRMAPTDLTGTLSVNEYAADGSSVGTLAATDSDSSSFTFALTNDAGGRFTIDSSTGEVKVAKHLLLDYEQATSHTIGVRVTDEAGLSYSENFTVAIGDVNPENLTGDTDANKLVGGAGGDRFDGDGGNDSLVGGIGRDTLLGGDGADTLDGGGSADSMVGGDGDDVYYVNQAGDVVVENADEGMDRVASKASYTLTDNVESLKLAGLNAIDGTGNGLDNLIRGNDAGNTLRGLLGDDTLSGEGGLDTLIGGDGHDSLAGGDGNDSLEGDDGNDTLNGGAGDDSMAGGDGDDSYIVEQAGDVVDEAADAGRDIVYSSIGYTLTANVEVLRLTGAGNVNGDGNSLDNRVEGNGGANDLFGGGGKDSLFGFGGEDTLRGGDDNDGLYGGDGNDLLQGGAGNDGLRGDAGNDTLQGEGGSDALYGGAGADRFMFDTASGKDKVYDFSQGDGDVLAIAANVNGGSIATAADALAAVSYIGGNAIVQLGGGNTVTLVGIGSGLTTADFDVY